MHTQVAWMTEQPRVTHRDIAAKVGCSRATVSLALSDNPRIREKVRQKIQKLAKRMGYRPDPILAELARHRFHPRSGSFRGSLAYIVDSIETKGAPYILQTRHLESAQKRADERGYQVFEFDLAEYKSSAAASKVLYNRGVRGVLIPTLPQPVEPLLSGAGWDRFAIVYCSLGWMRAANHIVTDDVFAGACLVWRKVVERGYRRIGGAIFKHTPIAQDDFARFGAFVAQQQELVPPAEQIPFLRCDPNDEQAFMQWFESHRPEVIISFISRPVVWLKAAGYRVPEDVAFACLGVWSSEPFSGLAIPDRELGQAAADFLIDQIHSNQCGVPKVQLSLLVEPRWQEGKTLPVVNAG
jgi:LacI family transcriptional regulator